MGGGVTGGQRLERLVRDIAPGGRLRRAWPLAGGISAAMTALEIEDAGGQVQRVIVRRPGGGNPRAARDEFRLLRAMQSTAVPAPVPLHLGKAGGFPDAAYLVVEYVEGALDFAPRDLDAYIRQLAAHLALIHRLDVWQLDIAFLPRQPGACGETASARAARVDGALDAGRIRNALASVGPPPRRNAPVLLHGDYWPGNMLWHDGRLVAVIDWEDARVGDPLVDLANARLEIAWILGLDAMHAFTSYYRSDVEIDDTGLPYWDLCAALRLVRLAGADLAGWAGFFVPYGRADITEGTIRTCYRRFVAQACERLIGSDPGCGSG